MGRHRANERATGNGLAGWPRNVSHTTNPAAMIPAQEATGEKMLADTEGTGV